MKARGGLLAFVLLVHAGLLWVYWRPEPKALLGDEGMYLRWAGELMAGRDPEPDLLWPPLYPRFLAAVLGSPTASLARVQAVQVALLVLVAFLLRDLTRRLTGRQPAAEAAAWLVLAYPPLVAFAHYLWPEVLHLALFLSAFWVLVARRESLAWMPLAGVLLGLALLTKSLLGPFLPVLLVAVLLGEDPWLRRLGRVAVVVGAVAATVAPTLLANRSRAGRLVIADSSRFNLWVGLNDRSRKSLVDDVAAGEYDAYRTSAPTFEQRNRVLEEKIRGLVAERGWLRLFRQQIGRQYFRLFDKDSYLTDQLPDGPVGRSGGGYRRTAPAVIAAVRVVSYVLYALVLTGAALGIALCPPRGRLGLWIVLGFLAYNLGIFLLLHVKSRYQAQFLPFVFLYAGCAWDWLRHREPTPSRLEWSLSIAGAALLLFLAFGGGLL